MRMVLMTVAEWEAVCDNPRQRDTERHAKKIIGDFSPWLEQGEIVQAACLPGGKLYKLNGHTRGYGWTNRLIYCPESIQVEIFDAKNVTEVIRMYQLYDNVRYSETSADLVSGCFHQLEFEPKSAYFRKGAVSMAIKYLAMECIGGGATGRTSLFASIMNFLPEIVKADNILVGCRIAEVPAWVLAAMLVSFRKHGDNVLEFWISYLDPRAEILSTSPIMLLRMTKLKAKEGIATGSKAGYRDNMGKALSAVSHWVNNTPVQRLHRVADLPRWVREG